MPHLGELMHLLLPPQNLAPPTALLLHLNGTNGSTSFPDSSIHAQAATAVGNAQISTAQSKFGGASAIFDGTGDAITVAADAEFEFGTGDYTAECWIYATTVSTNYRAAISFGNSTSGPCFYAMANTTGKPTFYGASGVGLFNHQTALTANTWHHLALVKQSGFHYIYLDGVKSTSSASYGPSMPTGTPVIIGASTSAGAEGLIGYIDEVRLVKGLALYTADFTPPAAPFPDP